MADLAIVVTDGIVIGDSQVGRTVRITTNWALSTGGASDAVIDILVNDVFSLSSILLNRAIRDGVRAYIIEQDPNITFSVQDRTVVFGAPSIV